MGEQLPYENYRGTCHTFQGWGVQPVHVFIGCIKTVLRHAHKAGTLVPSGGHGNHPSILLLWESPAGLT